MTLSVRRIRMDSETLLGTAAVLTIVAASAAYTFGPSLLRDMRERRILASGTPAEARVLDLRDTGSRFNGRSEVAIRLEVRPAGRAPFTAEVVRVIGLADIDRFARGRTVAVRFDPERPGRVAIAE